MTTTLRCLATLANSDAIPRDVVTNTYHVSSSGTVSADAATAATGIIGWYQDIGALFSSKLAGTGVLKIYDLTDNEPRAPVLTADFTFSPGAGQPLPHECAICVSYAAAHISGLAVGRRRGRIFMGPWDVSVLDDGAGDAIIDSGVTGAIAGFAGDMMDILSTATTSWVVFSPTTAGAPPWSAGELLAASQNVVGGYVDNAFDTIRSRGAAATLRSTFS